MPNVCCCHCKQWKKKTNTRLITTDSYAWAREKLNLLENPNDDMFLCGTCEVSARRDHEMEINSSQSSNSDDDQSNIMFDEYFSSPDHRTRCCICRVLLTSQAIELTTSARIDLLVDHDLYVPPLTRVCIKHIIRDHLSPDVSVNRSRLEPLTFNMTSGKDLINDLISQLRLVSKINSTTPLFVVRIHRISLFKI